MEKKIDAKKLVKKMYAAAEQVLENNKDIMESRLNPDGTAVRSLVVCVAYAESGKLYTGMNVAWWHSVCAENVAISNAWMAGERKILYIMAVKRNKKSRKIHIVSPCGICREMFRELMPWIQVVVEDADTKEVKFVPLLDLLPYPNML